MIIGMYLMDIQPQIIMNAGEINNGSKMLITVGFFIACNSERSISAITSSNTAAAIISWPMGVFNTLPLRRTFNAMPMDVGAKHAPMAMDDWSDSP